MNETFNLIKHLVVDNKAGILPYGPPFNVMLSFTIMTTFKRNKYFLLFTKSLIYYFIRSFDAINACRSYGSD